MVLHHDLVSGLAEGRRCPDEHPLMRHQFEGVYPVVDGGFGEQLQAKQNPLFLGKRSKFRAPVRIRQLEDTNVAQYLWLRLLAQGSNNICCVGDDDTGSGFFFSFQPLDNNAVVQRTNFHCFNLLSGLG